ncbi:MAG: hypothetical protein ABSB15_07875 [Bryobacteraceae bacterium]|jgi:hypothetical protein
MAGDRARDLRPAQARHSGDILAHQSFPPLQGRVLVPYQRPPGPRIHLLAALTGKSHFAASFRKRPNLLQVVASDSSMPTIDPQHPDPVLQAHLV